jgi:anti-sigma-K factor RskA
MISEVQSEQASLYVLGLLPADDARAFEAEMAENPALTAEVASLNNATLALARSAPALVVPPECRERVLTSVSAMNKNIIPLPQKSRLALIPWGIAACLAGLLGWQWNEGQRTKSGLEQSVATQVQATRDQATLVIESQKQLAKANQEHTQKLAAAEAVRVDWETKFTEAKKQLAATETDRQGLMAKLTALENKNLLTEAKIALLGSLIKDRPKAVAVSVWDQDNQTGTLVVENLPVLAKGRDYQLWVIDPNIKAPVSAGVFKVDAEGKVRIKFKPDQAIQLPGKFAVTEEVEGGAAAPTMNKMVVIGG